MATSLESNILEVGRLLHEEMMHLSARARIVAATLPVGCECSSEDMLDLSRDIENVKLLLANRITAVVLQSQVNRVQLELQERAIGR